jgi:Sec-independent protein translocase protein TatA
LLVVFARVDIPTIATDAGRMMRSKRLRAWSVLAAWLEGA